MTSPNVTHRSGGRRSAPPSTSHDRVGVEEGPAIRRVRAAYARIREVDRPDVWITLRPEAEALAEAGRVDAALARGADLPLAGTAVAVKDNIDVAGLPTTAGCREFAYAAGETAPAIRRLVEAGAVVLGKTNLDQFATGLVGTRSGFGVVRHAWLPERIAGGSSSGSAVAVALGIVDIGVGTDTAGSGRVPAAFQGIVGLKPTRGVIPTAGVVPASRSYDCVSVFALSVDDAEAAAGVMSRPAPGDPASRRWPADAPLAAPPRPVVAVPIDGQLEELPAEWAQAFEGVVQRLAEGGAQVVAIDVEPFLDGAELLYESALVAERYAAVGAFVDEHPDAVDPSVRTIVAAARALPAHVLVHDLERLERVRRRALEAISAANALLLPTAPEHPTLAAVAADPLGVNRRLGRFASFANPFDMAAVSVPAPESGEVGFGVTVFARSFEDRVAADVARRVCGEGPATEWRYGLEGSPLLVIGAHLSGQPLNAELTSLGARLAGRARTAPSYRLFALSTDPRKPGLVHVRAGGASVEGELWLLPPAGLGRLLASLPEPMTLGPVCLDDGSQVTGFLCQASATEGSRDISSAGSWPRYLESVSGSADAWT